MTGKSIIRRLLLVCFFIAVACDTPVYKVDEFVPRIRQHPTEADKNFNEGLALFMLNRWEEAAAALGRAVEMNPDDGQALFHLGLTYATLGRNDEARRAFDRAFEIGDSYGASREQMAVAARIQGDREREIDILEEAIRNNDPHPTLLLYRLGTAFYTVGREDDAIRVFEHAATLNPSACGSYGLFYVLGTIYLGRKELDGAIRSLEQQILQNPQYTYIGDTHYKLGIAYHMNGNYTSAVEQLEQVIASDPQNANAYYNLSTAYWLSGQRDSVQPLIDRLKVLDPDLATKLVNVLNELMNR